MDSLKQLYNLAMDASSLLCYAFLFKGRRVELLERLQRLSS